jgi:hypothetical protein
MGGAKKTHSYQFLTMLPRFHHAMNLKQNVTAGLNRLLQAAGLVLMLAAAGCASHGQKPATGTFIPQIARIANVQIGYSTQEDLERTWGEGLTTVGGHPNSGRKWRVPGTHWLVVTDGFEYSDRGLVVDQLHISEVSDESESWRQAPDARLDKQAFAWMDEISPAMPRDKVIEALKRHSLAFTQTDRAVEVQTRGFSPVSSNVLYNFRTWTVALEFQHDQLSRLSIEAGLERVERAGIAK